MAKSERNHKSRTGGGSACMEKMTLMDQLSSDDDDDNMTSSGTTPLLLDVDNAETKASETRRVNLLNLLMMSVIFLLQNAAFSIYYDDVTLIWKSPDLEQWWFISKSSFFGCYIFSCLLTPLLCEYVLSIKQCLLLGSLSISGIVFAQLIPHSFTLILASVFAGLFLPLYFTSQGSWLTTSSHRYACPLGVNLVNHSPESAITLFHAIFHCLYLSGPVWRNLLTVLILDDDYSVEDTNRTCGFGECSSQAKYNHTTHDTYRIFRVEALLGSFLSFSLAAVLLVVFCFTSPILNPDTSDKQKKRSMLQTCCPAAIENYIMCMCMSLAFGVEQYFIYNVFPQVLISNCYSEVQYTLFIITIAAVSSVFALLQGLVTRCTGRCKLLLFSGVVFVSLSITLLVLDTDHLNLQVVFILGCLWAAMDATWQTQLSALISIRYHRVKEFAFSSLRFWQMAGFVISYYFSRYLCNNYIIFVSIATITLATITYIASEIRLRIREQEMRHSHDSHYKLQDIDGASWIPTLNPLKARQRSALITLPSQQ